VSDCIALDGLPLQVRSAGIGVYADALVRHLAARHPETAFALYQLGGPAARLLPPSDGARPELPANVTRVATPLYPLVMGYPFPLLPRLLPVRLHGRRPVLFHATNYAAPRTGVLPLVVTVHDLALLRFPELGTPALRRLVGLARPATAMARLVIADSEATARDLRELLGVPAAKVRVVHPGGDAHPAAPDAVAARQHVHRRFGIAGPYLLHVGTLEPRKNLERLVRAYARVRARVGTAPLLVLAGGRGWGADRIVRTVAALGLADAVRFTGAVPHDDLPTLYAAAELFVYPSLYEGFGLPVVEAMACGAPVVTSNVSSLPEVAGDAAVLVDPRDESAIGDAVVDLLQDDRARAELRARGLARARQFTWARCAEQTWAVYEEALRA
jgi:glycosyltransferase involved in cell wall biosynthesis